MRLLLLLIILSVVHADSCQQKACPEGAPICCNAPGEQPPLVCLPNAEWCGILGGTEQKAKNFVDPHVQAKEAFKLVASRAFAKIKTILSKEKIECADAKLSTVVDWEPGAITDAQGQPDTGSGKFIVKMFGKWFDQAISDHTRLFAYAHETGHCTTEVVLKDLKEGDDNIKDKIDCHIVPDSYMEITADLFGALLMLNMGLTPVQVKAVVAKTNHKHIFTETWSGPHPKGVDRAKYITKFVDGMGTETSYTKFKEVALPILTKHTHKTATDCDTEAAEMSTNAAACKLQLGKLKPANTVAKCKEAERIAKEAADRIEALRKKYDRFVEHYISQGFKKAMGTTFNLLQHYPANPNFKAGEDVEEAKKNDVAALAAKLFSLELKAQEKKTATEFFDVKKKNAEGMTQKQLEAETTRVRMETRKRRTKAVGIMKKVDWGAKLTGLWKTCMDSKADLTKLQAEYCCRRFQKELNRGNIDDCKADFAAYSAKDV